MENVVTVQFKENAVPGSGKKNQVKNVNGEFAEMFAGTLGSIMFAGTFPGLTTETNIECQDALLGKNDTLVNENLANVNLVNTDKLLANLAGKNSSLTLEAFMNPVASGLKDPEQQDLRSSVTLENMFRLVEMKLNAAREGSPEGYIQLNSAEEGLNNLIKDVKGEALEQANATDFDVVTDIKNEDQMNLSQMDVAGGEILKAKLIEDAQKNKSFAEVNNNEEINKKGELSNNEVNNHKKANKNEQGNNEEVKSGKENLLEQKNDLAMKLGETSWSPAVRVNNGKEPDIPAMEHVVKAKHLTKDLPEIVLSKLKTFENKDGSKDVVIHLEPKELGKLVVKLTSAEGMVSVKIMAHYPLTRDLLESGLNNLRQSLLEQGISFDRLDVELGGQQLNQSQYQQQEQQTWRRDKGYYEKNTRLETNSYLENETPEPQRTSSLLESGRYDYLV